VKKHVLGIAAVVAFALMTASPAWAIAYYANDFNSYADDAALAAGGWTVQETATVVEKGAAWTVTNPGGRVNPPRFDGQPTTGGFLISDSDFAGLPSNNAGTGASHDLYSPAFSTVGGASVWLHMNVSAQLNNDGTAIFDVDVSTDMGESWTNAFRRISPGRGLLSNPAPAPLPDSTNADGFYGQLDVDLSSLAANLGDVRIRVRHFEPTYDWWIAIDDFKVDDVAPLAPGQVVKFSEDFSAGLGQMVVGGIQTGDLTWNCNDPGHRYGPPGFLSEPNISRLEHPGTDPNFAIIDVDSGGQTVDDYLMTPVLDLAGAHGVVLSYESEGSVPYGKMRVLLMRDSDDNGPDVDDDVVKVLFDYTAALHDPDEEPFYADRVLSVPDADGQDDVFFAWHFESDDDWWWAVDSIEVSETPRLLGDANGDGKVDDADASILGAHWRTSGALWEDGDFNGDTFVDDKDAAILAANWTESVVEPILGDASGDGVVDDEDASILGAHWLQPVSGGWDDGDFNTDGVVNDKDAAILAANWHAGVGAEEGSVPEPSTLVLVLGAAAMAWLGRRR
jgi:hypothetical protein